MSKKLTDQKYTTKIKGVQKYISAQIVSQIPEKKFKYAALQEHHKMSLTVTQVVGLYFIHKWNTFFGKMKPIKNKILTIFHEGNKRVNKSLDIVKLTKDIKYLKLLAMIKLDPDIETKFQIHHCSKNVIDLPDEEEEEQVEAKKEEEKKENHKENIIIFPIGNSGRRQHMLQRQSVIFNEINRFMKMRKEVKELKRGSFLSVANKNWVMKKNTMREPNNNQNTYGDASDRDQDSSCSSQSNSISNNDLKVIKKKTMLKSRNSTQVVNLPQVKNLSSDKKTITQLTLDKDGIERGDPPILISAKSLDLSEYLEQQPAFQVQKDQFKSIIKNVLNFNSKPSVKNESTGSKIRQFEGLNALKTQQQLLNVPKDSQKQRFQISTDEIQESQQLFNAPKGNTNSSMLSNANLIPIDYAINIIDDEQQQESFDVGKTNSIATIGPASKIRIRKAPKELPIIVKQVFKKKDLN